MSNLSWLSCLPCGAYLVAKLLHVPRSIFHVYCWYQLVISVDHLWKHQFVFVRLWPKMASTVDSEAHLARRATEVGLTDGALQSLLRSGFSTLGRGKDDEWKNKQWNKWQPYDPKKAKGKGKGGRTNMVPKVFKRKDCVSVDHHGRRLCFGYNLKKCSQVSGGAQGHLGWHLCLREGCHAPHPEKRNDNDRPPDPRQWYQEPQLNRLENLSGKEIYEALVIEVFCGTGRVTACLRQFGLSSSFGVDHVRPRNCVATVSVNCTRSVMFVGTSVYMFPPKHFGSRWHSCAWIWNFFQHARLWHGNLFSSWAVYLVHLLSHFMMLSILHVLLLFLFAFEFAFPPGVPGHGSGVQSQCGVDTGFGGIIVSSFVWTGVPAFEFSSKCCPSSTPCTASCCYRFISFNIASTSDSLLGNLWLLCGPVWAWQTGSSSSFVFSASS